VPQCPIAGDATDGVFRGGGARGRSPPPLGGKNFFEGNSYRPVKICYLANVHKN
jgi:hypothetical protein